MSDEATWYHHRMDCCIDCVVLGCENCGECPSNEQRDTMPDSLEERTAGRRG